MRCSSWPSCQAVCMDSESLPTGMATDSERLKSLAASTAARRAASWPGAPAAAIQLADSLTCESLRTLVPARLVRASPMAMRAEAAGWGMAGCGHSALDMADAAGPG